jgi:hypothetical protein
MSIVFLCNSVGHTDGVSMLDSTCRAHARYAQAYILMYVNARPCGLVVLDVDVWAPTTVGEAQLLTCASQLTCDTFV